MTDSSYLSSSNHHHPHHQPLSAANILDEVGWTLHEDVNFDLQLEPTPIGIGGDLVVVPEVSVYHDDKLRQGGIASDLINLMNTTNNGNSSRNHGPFTYTPTTMTAATTSPATTMAAAAATSTTDTRKRTRNNGDNVEKSQYENEDLYSLASFSESNEDPFFFSLSTMKGIANSNKHMKTTEEPASSPFTLSVNHYYHTDEVSTGTDNSSSAAITSTTSSVVGMPSSITSIATSTGNRSIQTKQWYARFRDLLAFKAMNGHCCVPNLFASNPPLAQWVKRQRYQYKLKQDGKHSTLTDQRQASLEDIGFVWDSHSAAWMERFNELAEFRMENGHANVPTNFPENRQLSIWVKCQRRQYKLFQNGAGRSNMTADRIAKLESLDFVWNPRGL